MNYDEMPAGPEISDADLARHYQNKTMTVMQMADKIGITFQAVYYRLKRAGVTLRNNSSSHKGLQAMDRNPNWKGGRRIGSNGYIILRIAGREVYEHRMVAARKIGRELGEAEVVHHLNGDAQDNRPENLEVLESQSAHMKEHMTTPVARERGRNGGRSRRAALKALAGEG